MANFELFMGELGNGLTVCNKAVEEHGDYKQIAHISPAGNIKWYVPIGYVPGPALLRIEHVADAMYHNYKDALERDIAADMPRMYYRMLDVLPTSALLDFLKDAKTDTLPDKVEKLKTIYLNIV